MKIRFQADANLNPAIGSGLERREPALDYRLARRVLRDGLPDHEVLLLAARDDRVLVTSDLRTMPRHFAQFLETNDSAGVLLIRGRMRLGEIVELLIDIWRAVEHEELRNQMRWL
ncbi:MAG: DUF5615 family PIN-like protein [Acidobacteriia bacterium]|nr:DUF5615 family PIN-like protein [Terriglobia bacterium]